MYIKYYSGLKTKMIWGFSFLFASIIQGIPFFFQVGNRFSMELFIVMFSLMPLWCLMFYRFFKSLFTPLIQVYKTEIILSRFQREVIPLPAIQDLHLIQDRIHLSYLKKGKLQSLDLDIFVHEGLHGIKMTNGVIEH